jgi:phosphotriesterase-related protein
VTVSEDSEVQTVLGKVPVAALGRTLLHEHMLLGYPGWDQDSLYEPDHPALLKRIAGSLRQLQERDFGCIVDVTPIDMGRDPAFLRQLAEQVEIHIVAATGFYHGGVGLHSYWRMKEIDELAEVLIHEIEHGVRQTGVKAGIVKVATRVDRIVPNEERALRAAARAAVAAGVNITTHTEQGKLGHEQLDIFESEGLASGRVIVGHLDNVMDLATHTSLLDRGAFIGFDQIGYEFRMSDAARIDGIAALVERGYAGGLILSHDRVGNWMGRLTPFLQQFADQVEKDGFNHLTDVFLPKLLAAGVSEQAADQMLAGNPARYFAGQGPLPKAEGAL